MVEEASGTRMFEERKEKAMTQMGKKDKTLAEMQSVSSFALSRLLVFGRTSGKGKVMEMEMEGRRG